MAKKIKCPKWGCGSVECVPLTDGKKYSVVKGAIGSAAGFYLNPVLTIPSALLGLNGKKKVKFMCTKCGKVFEVKL